MKRFSGVLVVVLCLLISSDVFADEDLYAKNFILSVGFGTFSPRGDISAFESTQQFTVSGLMLFGNYCGVGIDLGYHSTKLMGGLAGYPTENDLDTKSLEGLFYLQPNNLDVQPYIAAGIGGYYNQTKFKWNGATLYDDDGTTYGWVLKGGLRVFLSDYLMLGVYAKYFSANQDIKYATCCGSYYTVSSDIGGIIGSLDIGVRF